MIEAIARLKRFSFLLHDYYLITFIQFNQKRGLRVTMFSTEYETWQSLRSLCHHQMQLQIA